MNSPSFIQTLENVSPLFEHVTSLDEVLCLATFKASGKHGNIETVDDARVMWATTFKSHCPNCPYFKNCLACEINK